MTTRTSEPTLLADAITVRAVQSRREWSAFAKVPFIVYKSDPNWIPGDVADTTMMLRKPSADTDRKSVV